MQITYNSIMASSDCLVQIGRDTLAKHYGSVKRFFEFYHIAIEIESEKLKKIAIFIDSSIDSRYLAELVQIVDQLTKYEYEITTFFNS